MKSNERLIPDGYSLKFEYPKGDKEDLIKFVVNYLPALRSLDVGLECYGAPCAFTTAIAPLTYLRLYLPTIDALVELMSTPPLSKTLHQLHVKIGHRYSNRASTITTSDISMQMANLHTFTLVQDFFTRLKIEWRIFETLTSSKMMPVLRRANVSIFIDNNDLIHIGSAQLFTDHRHVDVHFAFHFINCPDYIKTTQYIPTGHISRPREIIGARFTVNHRVNGFEWQIDSDPFSRGYEYYHYIWYSLPWVFDEFFHEYIPGKWGTKAIVFQGSLKKIVISNKSSLRTLDAAGPTLASFISTLPKMASSDCIETLHLSFYNRSISIHLSNLRNVTLVNSINCLNDGSLFPKTISSICILQFYYIPNYMIPNWPIVFSSLSTLPQLNSLRVFMYNLPKAIDDTNCQIIAKMAPLFTDFAFCFRRKHCSSYDFDIDSAFIEHGIFVKQLYKSILLLCPHKQFHCSLEDDDCGLNIWF